jgi:hypothetical protein
VKRNGLYLASCLGFAALLCVPAPTWAQVAPPLGAAAQFGVLGNSAVTGATGSGVVVSGDVGSSPTPTINNFPPSTTAIPFNVHFTNDGVVQQAHTDSIAAGAVLFGQTAGSTVLPDDLSTPGVLTAGKYVFTTGAANLPASTTLTLNGPGIFVFNATTLTMNVLSNVVGTANPCNIFWRIVGGAPDATLNGNNFKGTVIADRSITLGAGASVQGRLLAGTGATGAVTMAGSGGNTIGGCSAAPPVCPLITVAPPTTPNGTVGVAYSQQITASGGTGPYTFAVSSGTLPAGLTLAPGGLLSGTPTTAGTSTVTIRAIDSSNGCPGTITYTITTIAGVPTLPQAFLLLLALGLAAAGYVRLRRRARAA